MYNNLFSDQLLPLITPEMLTRYPDQTCDILNRLIRLAQQSSTGGSTSGEPGNLENIVQTTTSYADGGVNVVTAYLSDGTTQDFQIRNGHQGSQGDPGQDSTIAVGTTTTLPAGSSATVTDSGTPSAAILNFGIPKGDKGDTGNPGSAATIAVGSTTTLAPGSSATVTNSGTSSAAVFDFGIPEGDKGDTGDPGADGFSPIANVTKTGDTATITITDENGTTTATVTDGAAGSAATITAGTTTTLPAGSSATVTNSGTSSAAVFDFGIPKGDTGAAGQDGADGFSPIATVSKAGDTATITITDENGTTTASVTDGSDGAPGAAATIAAGTTTTLSPGSSATVINSGTSSAAVFDFGIPQGATGAPGADGYSPTASVSKVGDTATITITDQNGTTTASVSDGATGSPGPANTLSIGTVQSGATADATITGTSPNQTLNLTLPKGDTGSPGAAATVAAGTTTTLPAGSSASVTNSGTSSAAVFDFSIPQGADGAGVASGGTTGQVLVKNSNTDYDTSWSTMTIPTVNDKTLTIQKNSTNVATFTANSSTDVTANITVPTSFSDLSGTVSSSQIASGAVTNAKIGSAAVKSANLDWTTLCSPTSETTHTSLANTYTKFYACKTSIRSVFGGHGFDFAAMLDFGGSSGAGTVNMTSIPGLSGYYGLKTQEKVGVTPSAGMLFSAVGRGYSYTPGSSPNDKLASYERWIAMAVGTDGYIYVNVGTSSSFSVASWQRIQFNVYGGIRLVNK